MLRADGQHQSSLAGTRSERLFSDINADDGTHDHAGVSIGVGELGNVEYEPGYRKCGIPSVLGLGSVGTPSEKAQYQSGRSAGGGTVVNHDCAKRKSGHVVKAIYLVDMLTLNKLAAYPCACARFLRMLE